MPGTNATLGYGSQLYCAPTGTTTWTKFAASRDLKGPEPEVGDVKITNNDSPANTHEYLPGMIEPGTQELDVVYNKTQCAAVYGKFGDGNKYDFAEVYPDGAGWTYTGYFKKFGTEGKTEDGEITNTITLKITTKPVFSATLGATVPGSGTGTGG